MTLAGASDGWLEHRRGWETVARGGETLAVLPAHEHYGMQAAVRLERDGVRITLVSESLRDLFLLEVVDTLERYTDGARER